MKNVLILFSPIVLLTSCIFQEPEGTVHYYYRVTGDATDVTIYRDEIKYESITTLPWQSEVYSQHLDDNTSLSCYLEATNNTTFNSTVTVEIYVDGDLKATDTATGPNCTAKASFSMSNTDL